MSRKKYRLPPPPRSDAPPSPAEIIEVSGQKPPPAGPLPTPIPVARAGASSEADGVNIIELQRVPRVWLRVTFALVAGTDPAQAALAAALFVTRLRAADKRLRLTVDRERSATTTDELVLVFAPTRGSSLAAGWLEEVKPVVRDLASAFGCAEVRAVEVVSE
jgi:hypothetical protein